MKSAFTNRTDKIKLRSKSITAITFKKVIAQIPVPVLQHNFRTNASLGPTRPLLCPSFRSLTLQCRHSDSDKRSYYFFNVLTLVAYDFRFPNDFMTPSMTSQFSSRLFC